MIDWPTAAVKDKAARSTAVAWLPPAFRPYASAAMLSLVIVAVVMELWRADLRVPFVYQSEAFFNATVVKATLDRGWPLEVPALGAPGRLDLRDVPLSDSNLHIAVIRLLGLASTDYAVVMNLFLLLTFPLTALSALFVFRRFGAATLPALFGSLLYAFLPFHFQRGQLHLFLAAYYIVPLAVMVALWIAGGAVALVEARAGRWSGSWCRPKLLASALVCVALGASGVYYAFFACCLMLLAGALAAVRARDARFLALPVGLVLLTFSVLAVNYAPNIRYVREHGATRLVLRHPVDAEVYALRIWQLLAPVTKHRLAWAAQLKESLVSGRPRTESDDSSLGIIGGIGFLMLLGWLVRPRRHSDNTAGVIDDLSRLNLAAVLLATAGGFGSLVALLLPQIRAYNRMSIYIAFLSLFAVVTAVDVVQRRWCPTGPRRKALALVLGVLLVVGLFDQTGAQMVPRYRANAADHRHDAAFFGGLAATFPPGAMIFQLPAIAFPEHVPVQRMLDYDHARAYLHAPDLRWSYGAVRGREVEAWQAWVAAQPVPALVETLVAAGFSGLYVNRDAYADGAAKLTGELTRALGESPVNREHPRLLVFDLRPYGAAVQARYTAEEWAAKQDAARHPVLVVWERGCFDLEGTPQENFRWCSSAGEWRLTNSGRHARRVTFEMSLGTDQGGTLWLDSPFIRTDVRIGPVAVPFSHTVTVPPGRHTIRFRCDAPRVRAQADARYLVFQVRNFRIIPAD